MGCAGSFMYFYVEEVNNHLLLKYMICLVLTISAIVMVKFYQRQSQNRIHSNGPITHFMVDIIAILYSNALVL